MTRYPLKVTLAAAAITAGGAAQAQTPCDDVAITEMDWASSAIVTHVATFLMEQGYGCDVLMVPSSTTPAMASVAETGRPDIVTEVWPNGNPAYDGLVEAGKIATIANVLSDSSVQGWYVPTYLVEDHPELATLQGILDNPDLVGGRLHSCPDGWQCKDTTESIARAVDLEGAGIELFQHGSGETLATSMAAAVENREPWLGYYWEPTSLIGKYEMTRVDLGPFDAEVWACTVDPDCEEDGLTAYASTPVVTVVTTTFADDQPELAALMSNVAFTNAQMGDVLAWQEDNSASAEEAAVYFLTTYDDVWPAWLNDEARANLSALIE
ncbi:glycine/betaine ABC transporter substrate-binding protein [Jannaschia sp. S6380]|uniref:glycine betaine ABC transporter substrate-binding protein n=1 Tax=Jannaschia sp. S6380 TaxID=2926408 RepID=UPI001FF13218|nr:glycine betaine ABC transporter substrate-binding protein [Jannaschia sp. S6380]MCK0167915.1 glycine/betaine ABC transporter substrate-binding protein [Jannaschia sp. S6380]